MPRIGIRNDLGGLHTEYDYGIISSSRLPRAADRRLARGEARVGSRRPRISKVDSAGPRFRVGLEGGR